MSLQFDPPDDEDRFHAARAALLSEWRVWAGSGTDADPATFVDWRYWYSTGDLGAFTIADLDEFLLDWCPRKVASSPEFWMSMVDGVRSWIEFLEATGRWTGGRTSRLLAELDEITPEFLDAMSNPSNFGMGKGLLASVPFADVDFDDPASIQSAIDAFNALPFEERKTITDPGFAAKFAEPEPIVLPPTAPPDVFAALEQAEHVALVEQLARVSEYLGAGRALTPKGNPKLADVRAMLELVPTDEKPDHTIGGHEYKLRSADQLPHLMYLLDVGLEAGALRRHGGKLVGVKAWATKPGIERVERLLEVSLGIGPIFGRGVTNWNADEAELLEDGLFHWLVPAFVLGEQDVDEIVDRAVEVLDLGLPRRFKLSDPAEERRSVERDVEKTLDIVERCGLVTRTRTRVEIDRYSGRERHVGGVLTLTELGRYLLPPYLREAGYEPSVRGPIGDLDVSELLDMLAFDPAADVEEAWEAWRPSLTPEERATLIVAAMASTDSPHSRLVGMTLLARAGAVAADPARRLLGTPLSGHGAMFLTENGYWDDSRDGPIDRDAAFGPLVDMLAVDLEAEPEEFIGRFDALIPAAEAVEVIGLLWRVNLPEALAVLEAVGRSHPTKATAKAARKAAMQHRSRYRR